MADLTRRLAHGPRARRLSYRRAAPSAAARLAGALRERCRPRARRPRRDRRQELRRVSRDRSTRSGTPALAAVPANAKLHGAELGYILEHSGARVCFASRGLDGEIAPHAPTSLERLIVDRQRGLRSACSTADPIAVAPRAADDLAWLFYTSGTTGRPEGRDADPPRARRGEPRLCDRGRHDRAGRSDPARRADEPRLRPLHHGARDAARRQRGAGIRRLRAGGDLPPVRAPGRAPRCSPRPPWSSGWSSARPTAMRRTSAPSSGAARRCMSRTRCRALDRFGPRLAQIYGQGESPMTITMLSKAGHRRPRPSALARAARLGRPAVRAASR